MTDRRLCYSKTRMAPTLHSLQVGQEGDSDNYDDNWEDEPDLEVEDGEQHAEDELEVRLDGHR